MKIGFIGQGFVGKHIADDFENRGYEIVRFALEPAYQANKNLIATCDVVFVAVPTPTTPAGFDYSIVENVLTLVGDGKIAVIKSTLIPGTTKKLQARYPQKHILFSPEFLCEATAAHDAAHPILNIVGLPSSDAAVAEVGETVRGLLPPCAHQYCIDATTAEFFKYTHNIHGFFRVIFSNVLYDLSEKEHIDWSVLKPIMDSDPMMSPYYNAPIHKTGRGAGGNCFIKDFAAFKEYAGNHALPETYMTLLAALEKINLDLLKSTGKDLGIIESVYGKK
jgi:UDP-glucose 6-dehydrogenase